MARALVRLGDKTTSGGEVISASSTIIEDRNIALSGDMAWCPKETCNGPFQINGTAYYFAENKPCVATGDQVLCNCKNNQVMGTTTLWVEDSPGDPFEEHQKRAAEWPINQAIAAAAASSALPVFAKSCLRGEGCTDAGTDQESVDNFGHAGYYRALPQPKETGSDPVQHAQAAKKHKPAEPTSPPEDNHPWYKRLFSSPDAPKAAATAGMATARAATTAGVTTDVAIEAGYAALQKIGGNLSAAGRWIVPNPTTVFLFGIFYSPKLNSGEQDYIDKMRLEQAARNKEDVPTRVRFRWEAEQNGMIRPKGFHVSAGGGQDKVPVRMLQKNSATGNYEFWEDSASKPTIVWTPDDPGYESPSNTGNRDNVYVPPSVLVYPESEINSPWSTETPAPGERPFRDYILVHPAGTFDPIYVYIRNLPGQVTGKGQKISGTWLADAVQGNGSPIPSQIADKLRGRTFSNFDDFRQAFWLEVSKDPELSKQFDPRNLATMKNGRSAYARKPDSIGQRVKYELHHIEEIRNSGAVYDVDNLGVTTPKRHIEIHQGK
ncbi:killer protein of pyocin s3 [Citrobacter braakii]|uniref:S-type pyocin domain-containing protein n=2 Tax=Enterobacteriaceae TaxID=543 RepID=UPI0015EA8733|nr:MULTISPECIES: S-type pyocin domain-containing protein [Citrobacter]MBM3059870.1 killer protein of pyocin s3 [Citrobacter braakii]MBM3064672.1 killer protein of pyocin s3 [Citrobacter braakii]QLS53192.1 S-type pyocin domain-containing protein [Citrobacter sp. RHBSTW-00887]WBU74711.1 S-type pyocin domain-containing protein [Citrobacter braakii]